MASNTNAARRSRRQKQADADDVKVQQLERELAELKKQNSIFMKNLENAERKRDHALAERKTIMANLGVLKPKVKKAENSVKRAFGEKGYEAMFGSSPSCTSKDTVVVSKKDEGDKSGATEISPKVVEG